LDHPTTREIPELSYLFRFSYPLLLQGCTTELKKLLNSADDNTIIQSQYYFIFVINIPWFVGRQMLQKLLSSNYSFDHDTNSDITLVRVPASSAGFPKGLNGLSVGNATLQVIFIICIYLCYLFLAVIVNKGNENSAVVLDSKNNKEKQGALFPHPNLQVSSNKSVQFRIPIEDVQEISPVLTSQTQRVSSLFNLFNLQKLDQDFEFDDDNNDDNDDESDESFVVEETENEEEDDDEEEQSYSKQTENLFSNALTGKKGLSHNRLIKLSALLFFFFFCPQDKEQIKKQTTAINSKNAQMNFFEDAEDVSATQTNEYSNPNTSNDNNSDSDNDNNTNKNKKNKKAKKKETKQQQNLDYKNPKTKNNNTKNRDNDENDLTIKKDSYLQNNGEHSTPRGGRGDIAKLVRCFVVIIVVVLIFFLLNLRYLWVLGRN
ncbi:CCCH-type zinc finger-containing protein, partial [Reticulomyxa filosa]